jgi:hypothetical protein
MYVLASSKIYSNTRNNKAFFLHSFQQQPCNIGKYTDLKSNALAAIEPVNNFCGDGHCPHRLAKEELENRSKSKCFALSPILT